MFKIIAAVAVATTVQTASAAKSNDLVFRDCVPAPGETADPDCESWPTPHTIKLANPDYNATDPDSIRFVQANVALGPDRFKAAKCKSTTGFDYVGPSLIQQGLAAAVEDAEVEENEFQIFNTYGAGINYCRYTCQETQGCLYYTLANNRCNLKGEGTVLKQLKAGKTTQGGACTPRVPDADLRTTVYGCEEWCVADGREWNVKCSWDGQCSECSECPAPTPAPAVLLDTCEAHSIYDDSRNLVDVNIELRKQCRTFKADPASADFDCLFTKKRRRANGEPGGCYTKPEPNNWDADDEPNAVPTPSPRHCRKQCANKFDRLKRGKGKSSYEHVCGLKNCKDCIECTLPPMVNYTVQASSCDQEGPGDCWLGGVWRGDCPMGCKAPANATTGDLCYDQSATIKEIAAETNLCAPLFYGGRDEEPGERSTDSCPTGCVSHGVVRPADSFGNERYAKVCIRDESFSTEDMKEYYSPFDLQCTESDGCAGCTQDGDGIAVEGVKDCSWHYDAGECHRTDRTNHCEAPSTTEPYFDAIPELCIGPVEKHRMCVFTQPLGTPEGEITSIDGEGYGTEVGVDFKTKVIARITKKGFWETHCQEECYQNEECGAFVYTRGTCKLFETVDEAPEDEGYEYAPKDYNKPGDFFDMVKLWNNVKFLRNANKPYVSYYYHRGPNHYNHNNRWNGICVHPRVLEKVLYGGYEGYEGYACGECAETHEEREGATSEEKCEAMPGCMYDAANDHCNSPEECYN